MKKLLALVLALVMTMSLVTISNAAFSDVDKIDHKEAVEVMNAVGVLKGMGNNTFDPKAELTRAQAAKIICTMLLGQSAADGLSLKSSFADVSGWAESYIAYCASQGIIAGVGNGNFDPEGKLTGYAFAKMLLVALGYDAEFEGLVGSDWQVNVAKHAINAKLNKDFDGSLVKNITRDEAAQFAFNTMKATMVDYTNGTKVETSDGTKVTVNSVRYNVGDANEAIVDSYKNTQTPYTQFCEQYFEKLAYANVPAGDKFGRPAHQWAFKGVSVGTYGETADKVYTAAASGDNYKEKIANMGIKGYTLRSGSVTPSINGSNGTAVTTLNGIVDLTGNGTVVELFFNDNNVEEITHIVVTKTQLMQVKSINKSAKTVSLKKVDNFGANIAIVDDENDNYAALAAMKADDYVLITYVNDNGTNVVSSIATPQVVTGKLTRVSTNASSAVNGVTVAGTAYSLAATRGTAFAPLNNTSIDANTDCKLFLDSYGYAVFIDDVRATTQYIVASNKYSSLVDGKIVNFLSGYAMDGTKLSLNLGTLNPSVTAGTVYAYSTTNSNDADYALGAAQTSSVGAIAKNATKYGAYYLDKDVEFLFVSLNNSNTEIDSVVLKSGVQEVASGTTTYAILNNSGDVKTVVVIGEPDVGTGNTVAYVKKLAGYAGKVDGKQAYFYDLYINGELVKGVQSKDSVAVGSFVTFEESNGLYTLRAYTETTKTTSVTTGVTLSDSNIKNGRYLSLDGTNVDYTMAADGVVIDLTADKLYGDLTDMEYDGVTHHSFTIDVVYNGNASSSEYKTVSYIFITNVT